MRKTVLLLASAALAMLLASGVAVAQEGPPATYLYEKPDAMSNEVSPTFKFSSSEEGSTFQCELDAQRWAPCTSPKRYTLLSEGTHHFGVIATDSEGNLGEAAEWTWTIDSIAPKAANNSWGIHRRLLGWLR